MSILESVYLQSNGSYYLNAAPDQYDQSKSILNPVYFGKGLANCVREKLLSEKREKFALLVDWAITEDMTGLWLTVEEIAAIAPFSDYLLREALEDELIQKKARKTGKRGRPAMLYRIPDKDTVRKYVTPGNLTKSDHLPTWAYKSVKTYKAAMYMALILRGCQYISSRMVSYSRKFLTSFLNVSKKTLRNYEKQYGIYVEPVFSVSDLTDRALFHLPTRKRFGEFLSVTQGIVTDKVPAIKSLAIRALQQGAQVKLIQRMPNKYSLMNWSRYKNGAYKQKEAYFGVAL